MRAEHADSARLNDLSGQAIGFGFTVLKTVRELNDVHGMQCTNYLKATGPPLCLLLNDWKSNVWSEACEPHQPICVLCVHLLSSAFKFLLAGGAAALIPGAKSTDSSAGRVGIDISRHGRAMSLGLTRGLTRPSTHDRACRVFRCTEVRAWMAGSILG
ncbi:MAG TPA: GxxExxY protein, partial [Acetobacteraceae bacterium]